MNWKDEEATMIVRPKSRQHNFYKSITILGLFAFVLCLQVALRQEDQQQQSLGYKHPRNISRDFEKYQKTSNNGRKLLQTSDSPLPEYCTNGNMGDPFDPICPCDPTDGGDESCVCPVTELLDYADYPCGWDVVVSSIILTYNLSSAAWNGAVLVCRKTGITGQKDTFPPPWESIGYVLETY